MARLALNDVGKTFSGGIVALREVTLRVPDGQWLAVVGPSGCGKTSLLRVIAGLEPDHQGRVEIDGRSMQGVAPRRRDVAMVFQGDSVYPHLSVAENLAFPLQMRKVKRAEIQQRVRVVAREIGIEDLLPRRPSSLSGGQRQRVALGRALIRKPRLFLLDEPFSQLDIHLRRDLRKVLRKLRGLWPATTILVTHDQDEALAMGDRVAVMSAGEVRQCDTPEQLLNQPANRFVAGFIGQPPMNFIRGDIQGVAGGRCVFVSPVLQFPLPDRAAAIMGEALGDRVQSRPVELGVRPSAIQAADSANDSTPGTPTARVVFPARIELHERYGENWLLHLRLTDQTELACPMTQPFGRPGEVHPFQFHADQAFFFDAGSGRNLLISSQFTIDPP